MSLETQIKSLITAIGADIKTLFGKQSALVSGSNIKTVNGASLLGSGDLLVGSGITAAAVAMTATQANTTVALVDVTQLVLPLAANSTYMIDCFLTFQSAATTTGIGVGFVAPTGSKPMLEIVVPLVSTAAANALRTTFPNATSTTSGRVLGTGVTAITSNHTARVSGLIKTTSAGNIQIQFMSEVATSAVTLQIGSTLVACKVA